MRAVSIRIVLAILVTGCAAIGQDSRPASRLVKLGAPKGTILHYEMRTEDLDAGSPGETQSRMEIIREYEVEVLESAPDGGVIVEERVTRKRMSTTGTSLGPFAIDSVHASREADPNRRLYQTLLFAEIGRPIRLTLDPLARIVSVSGVEALRDYLHSKEAGIPEGIRPLLEAHVTKDHQRATLQAYFCQLPPKPAAIGLTWPAEAGWHDCPGQGETKCESIPLTSRVTALTPDEITIASASAAVDSRKVADYGRVTHVEAQARVSRRDGFPLVMTVDIESVSPTPLAERKHRNVTRIRHTFTRLPASADAASRPASKPGR